MGRAPIHALVERRNAEVNAMSQTHSNSAAEGVTHYVGRYGPSSLHVLAAGQETPGGCNVEKQTATDTMCLQASGRPVLGYWQNGCARLRNHVLPFPAAAMGFLRTC